MTTWTELVDAAVLGAGRTKVPAPSGVLAALAAPGQVDGDAQTDSGSRLLQLAAVASRARRAGYRPDQAAGVTAPVPAGPDQRPQVSRPARQRLGELLAEGRTALTIEWLRLLDTSGRRPPDVLLPALLTAATDNHRIREVLAPSLGPRARWLAAANPAWEWAAGSRPPGDDDAGAGPAGARWSTASHHDRRELLRRLRVTDPAAGRDLVLSTWSSDSYRDRADYLGELAAGLSQDDESLLNQALADRRAEVRRAAADLLARLPDSAFAHRAVVRAAAAVRADRHRLLVSPPAEAGEEMIADGLDPSPPRGTGKHAWLLRQVVAAAPASWWAGRTGLPPAGLLALSARTEWAAALEAGWSDAAIRDRDHDWIEALLDRPLGAGTITVFQALTDADRDTWLARHPDSPLLQAVELVPGPWSAALSDAARRRIAAIAGADPGRSPEARKLLRLAALRLEPPEPPPLDPALVHPRLHESLADMLSVLSIRAAMRRELSEEPTL